MQAKPLAALLVLLAGCFGATTQDGGLPPAATADQLAAAAPFTILLCNGGFRIAAPNPVAVDECNHRVTHPLPANGTADWRAFHGPANEVSVAVNPLDPLVVAGGAKDYTVSYLRDPPPPGCGKYTVWMGTFSSKDGGLSWSDDLMPGFPGDPRPSPLAGNLCNTDPVVAFDDDGTFVFSGLNYGGVRRDSATPPLPDPLYPASSDLTTATQIYFARSLDGGRTFDGAAMSFCGLGDNGLQFNDKQWFALQPAGDHAIVTWTPYYAPPPGPSGVPDPTGLLAGGAATSYISYCESMDGGATWSAQQLLVPGAGPGGAAGPIDSQFSMPAYLPGGTGVAVIWAADTDSTMPADLHPQGDMLTYTEGLLTPGGVQFQPAMSAFAMHPVKSGPDRDGTGPTRFRVATYPVLAVDTSGGPHDGRRYVAWADQAGPLDSDVQVLLRHSDDGRTWSDPVTVNDEPRGDQFVPWLDVDPKGGVHVAWYDRRNSPDNRLMDVYYAYSDDGGESFHANVRVTETSFDGDLGHHQSGAPFIGDYIGLDTSAISATVFWADTRHTGDPGRAAGSDVYSATLLRDAEAAIVFGRAYAAHPA